MWKPGKKIMGLGKLAKEQAREKTIECARRGGQGGEEKKERRWEEKKDGGRGEKKRTRYDRKTG